MSYIIFFIPLSIGFRKNIKKLRYNKKSIFN